MVRGYPRLIERFPAYREEVLRRRFQDELIDELCRDYDRVLSMLDAGQQESGTSRPDTQQRQELQALARKLEHEFLERLASKVVNEKNLK
jgi:hypothetical protein